MSIETDEQLQIYRDSDIYPLMPLLTQGVLHVTNVQGFKAIHESGTILPNKGDLPFSYPQSKTYYGPSRGWVCLFDFESAREGDYGRTHNLWNVFFVNRKPQREPATIVIKLNRQKLADKLIPNSARPKPGEAGYKPALAYIEVWYPEAISTSAFDSYILIWRNPVNHLLEYQQFSIEDVDKLDERISSLQQEYRSVSL